MRNNKRGEITRAKMFLFIHNFMGMNCGLSPSVREIMIGINVKSANTVLHHLKLLTEDGLIERRDGFGSRNIKLPDSFYYPGYIPDRILNWAGK